MCVRVFVRVFVHTCVRSRMRACVFVCACFRNSLCVSERRGQKGGRAGWWGVCVSSCSGTSATCMHAREYACVHALIHACDIYMPCMRKFQATISYITCSGGSPSILTTLVRQPHSSKRLEGSQFATRACRHPFLFFHHSLTVLVSLLLSATVPRTATLSLTVRGFPGLWRSF